MVPPIILQAHLQHSLFVSWQGEISDLPRFCLFYIAYGLEVITLILSGIADVPPNVKKVVKQVQFGCTSFELSYCYLFYIVLRYCLLPLAQCIYLFTNECVVSSPSSFTMKTNTLSTSVPNSYYPGKGLTYLPIISFFFYKIFFYRPQHSIFPAS